MRGMELAMAACGCISRASQREIRREDDWSMLQQGK